MHESSILRRSGDQPPRRGIEAVDVAAAASGLVLRPADRNLFQAAEQQRTHATVRDDRHVAVAARHRQHMVHRRDDPALRIGRAFPAAYAFLRAGEERFRRRLEFRWREITRRGTVVLAQFVVHDRRDAQRTGQQRRHLRRLPLAAAEHRAHPADPWPCQQVGGAPQSALRQRPVRHGNGRVDRDLGVRDEMHDGHASPAASVYRGCDADRHPLRAKPHRLPASRPRVQRAVRLAPRARGGRAVPAAPRGHRSRRAAAPNSPPRSSRTWPGSASTGTARCACSRSTWRTIAPMLDALASARPAVSVLLHPRRYPAISRRAAHAGRGAAAIPGTCRALSADEREARIAAGERHALRLDMAAGAALLRHPV